MFDGNMQQQNGFFGQGGYNYAGMNPAQAQPIKNALTDDEIKLLMANVNNFSLGLTEKEVLRAKCTHRKPNGTEDSLTFDPNTGEAKCLICGYSFKPIDPDVTPDSIIEGVSNVIDFLQTIKLYYPTLPADAVGEYFQIIPLLEKIPELFKIAVKEFTKNDVNPWNYTGYNMNGPQMFANLMNAFGNGFMNQPTMGAPVYGQQPQQFMGQAPMMNQPVQQPGFNAFGYPGASQQQGYVPQTPAGFAYQPNQQVPVQPSVAAPATPANTEAVDTVTTTVNA